MQKTVRGEAYCVFAIFIIIIGLHGYCMYTPSAILEGFL